MAGAILFTVKKNSEVGRFAVAKRALKAGELIFEEDPFTYGPKSEFLHGAPELERVQEIQHELIGLNLIADSPVLCLGCFAPADGTALCPTCAWPVCTPECANLPIHKANECQIFSLAGAKFQPPADPSDICLQYECITPLRVLLAKERDPKRWTEEIEPMEAHNDIRQTKPIWNFNQVNVVEYLRGPCKLDRFSDELIHTVCGILEMNAFEARALSGFLIRCLYPKLAILSHNCVSNIHHSVAPEDFKVLVRTTLDVPENGELFSSYTYSLWPTLERRDFLKESKCFECKCPRCCDRTELGTHIGTLKCNKCDGGVILSTDPLSFDCEWKCTDCAFTTSARAVRKIYEIIQTELEAVEWIAGPEGIEHREAIFRRYRAVLHPKNAYMTILRTALSQLYGKADGYTIEDLPDLLLERKIELCNDLLKVLDVVEPGLSRIRGVTLYELHAPLMVLARNQYNADVMNKEEFRKRMEEALEVLRQSVEILKNEVPSSNEGQLGIVAEQAYDSLVQNFELLIETA